MSGTARKRENYGKNPIILIKRGGGLLMEVRAGKEKGDVIDGRAKFRR